MAACAASARMRLGDVADATRGKCSGAFGADEFDPGTATTSGTDVVIFVARRRCGWQPEWDKLGFQGMRSWKWLFGSWTSRKEGEVRRSGKTARQ